MEEYLITARSVTHAQRMAQALERKGLHAVVARAPMGPDGSGLRLCAASAWQGESGGSVEAAAGVGIWPRRRRFSAGMRDTVRWSYDLF